MQNTDRSSFRGLFALIALSAFALPRGAEAQINAHAGDATSNPSYQSYVSSMSHDGSVVAFSSNNPAFTTNDTNGSPDVYVSINGTRTLVSSSATRTAANGVSEYPSLSADGTWIAYQSMATNLTSNGSTGHLRIFLQNLTTGARACITPTANDHCYCAKISANGRFVAYVSAATNLVAGDTNNADDIFVYDRISGRTECVSQTDIHGQSMGFCSNPDISGDGRYVVYCSDGADVVMNDANGQADIFLYDRKARSTSRVSVASTWTEANAPSFYPSISANGRYVAFCSMASNLTPDDHNGAYDVFVRDLQTYTTSRVSGGNSGESNSDSYTDFTSCISEDGRYVAYTSDSINLIPGDTNGCSDIFVYDRLGNANRCVSNQGSTQSNGQSLFATLSLDGSACGFSTYASNIGSGLTGGTLKAQARTGLIAASQSSHRFNLYLQNSANGGVYYWSSNGASVTWSTPIINALSGWGVTSQGDFGGFGRRWMTLQKPDGTPYLWAMNPDGTAIETSTSVYMHGSVIGPMANWRIVASLDTDGDGRDEILLQNSSTGAVAIWVMNASKITSIVTLWPGGDPNWRVFAVADLDNDGTPDILLQNSSTGALYKWRVNPGGNSLGANGYIVQNGLSGWRAVGATHFDGDETTQIVLRNNATGAVSICNLSAAGVSTGIRPLWAGGNANWRFAGFADLDGDWHPDMLFQYAGAGEVYAWKIQASAILTSGYLYNSPLPNWNLLAP